MKTNEVSRLSRFLLAGIVVVCVGACGEDKPTDSGGDDGSASKPLEVKQIIANPRTAAPGDTLVMTADLRSTSNNAGDIPTLAWTDDCGDDSCFVEDNQLTVRWVAPTESDVFTITVKATNSVGTATGHVKVFVGGEIVVVADQAGAVTLISGGPDFYYRRTANIDIGTDVFKSIGGFIGDAAPPTRANNFDTQFAPDLSFEAHSIDTSFVGVVTATIRPRHIHVSNLAGGTFQRISVDTADSLSQKRHQFSSPSISPNNHLVAYQAWQQSPDGSAIDSFHVYVYDLTQTRRVKVTAGQQFPRNFFPTFSTDQKWLTFVSDPTGVAQWEIYGMPVTGDVVDTDPLNMKRMSNTGGSIGSGAPGALKSPMKAWNPVAPDLAVLATDGTLYIVQTNAGGGTSTDVAGLPGSVQELRWAPDGSRLAVVLAGGGTGVGGAVYLVASAAGTKLLSVPSGDLVRDLVWSPDGQWVVYRRTRGSSSWIELQDIDASAAPIPITGNWPAGEASKYRVQMSLSPAWGFGDLLYIPTFGISPGGDRPGIITVDITGAIQ